jgi:hypothetical protein
MKASDFVLIAGALLASTQLAAAQGTSGGTGAVASIPGSVVRGHEQGPGLFSILNGSTPPTYHPTSVQRTMRPGDGEAVRKPAGK